MRTDADEYDQSCRQTCSEALAQHVGDCLDAFRVAFAVRAADDRGSHKVDGRSISDALRAVLAASGAIPRRRRLPNWSGRTPARGAAIKVRLAQRRFWRS